MEVIWSQKISINDGDPLSHEFNMNLGGFRVFLLFWSCVLAQNELEQDHNVEAFDNNADFGQGETEENPTHVVQNTNVDTDGIENINMPETVGNDVELTQKEPDQNLAEDFSEFIVDNGEYPIGTDIINAETAGNNVDQEAMNYPGEIFIEGVTNDERDSGTDSSNIQEQNELVQNHNEYSIESGSPANLSPVKTAKNSVGDEINGKKHIGETDPTDVSVHDQLDQKYNADVVDKGHIIEVLPKYEVNHNVPDTGINPTEVVNQGNNADFVNKNDQETEQDLTEVGIDESNLGEDAIEILGLPVFITNQNLQLTIRYSITGSRIFVIDIFTVGVDHADTIYHTEWIEVSYYPGETKERLVRITLPDNLVYKEDRILRISPDLHSESLLFLTIKTRQ